MPQTGLMIKGGRPYPSPALFRTNSGDKLWWRGVANQTFERRAS